MKQLSSYINEVFRLSTKSNFIKWTQLGEDVDKTLTNVKVKQDDDLMKFDFVCNWNRVIETVARTLVENYSQHKLRSASSEITKNSAFIHFDTNDEVRGISFLINVSGIWHFYFMGNEVYKKESFAYPMGLQTISVIYNTNKQDYKRDEVDIRPQLKRHFHFHLTDDDAKCIELVFNGFINRHSKK